MNSCSSRFPTFGGRTEAADDSIIIGQLLPGKDETVGCQGLAVHIKYFVLDVLKCVSGVNLQIDTPSREGDQLDEEARADIVMLDEAGGVIVYSAADELLNASARMPRMIGAIHGDALGGYIRTASRPITRHSTARMTNLSIR